jgi:xylan 1,4-beta-xylosidase
LFWTGSQSDYFALYAAAATAIKAVDPRLRVGGPASAQSQWLDDLVNFTAAHGLPLDFVSTHLYPSDPQPEKSPAGFTDAIKHARSLVPRSLPLVYTEFNSGLWEIPQHDNPYAAAFLINTIARLNASDVDFFSYWTFSDVFEEGRCIVVHAAGDLTHQVVLLVLQVDS